MGKRKASDCTEIFRTGKWFASIPETLQQELLAAGRVRELQPGERLFSRGDACSGLYGLVEGSIRVSGTSAEGKEALLVVLEPPSWFGEIAVFDERPRTHDAYADGDTTLVEVPLPALHGLLNATPLYWRDLGRLVAGKMRLTFATLEDTAILPVSQRLARRLAMMADGYGQWRGPSKDSLAVSQDQLAQMLGSSRQTINQNLKALEADGVLRIAYGSIEIIDLPGLRARAQLEG